LTYTWIDLYAEIYGKYLDSVSDGTVMLSSLLLRHTYWSVFR